MPLIGQRDYSQAHGDGIRIVLNSGFAERELCCVDPEFESLMFDMFHEDFSVIFEFYFEFAFQVLDRFN